MLIITVEIILAMKAITPDKKCPSVNKYSKEVKINDTDINK